MTVGAKDRKCYGRQENRDRPAQRIGEYVSQGQLRFDAAEATRSLPQQKAHE